MNIIAAVDRNWGIGYRGRLLVSIPNDQRHFREETIGKVVVLGRRTLQTFPQGMPLQGRRSIRRRRSTASGGRASMRSFCPTATRPISRR